MVCVANLGLTERKWFRQFMKITNSIQTCFESVPFFWCVGMLVWYCKQKERQVEVLKVVLNRIVWKNHTIMGGMFQGIYSGVSTLRFMSPEQVS